jgi:hypothetical protein
MTRPSRILLRIMVAASALLCIAAVLLWARSYRIADSLAAGYWNYRPHKGAADFLDADMLQVFHGGGRWTITRCRRNCVAMKSRDVSTHSGQPGPGDRGDLWLIEHPPASQWAGLELEAWDGRAPPGKGLLGLRYLSARHIRTLCLPDAFLVTALSLAPMYRLVRWRLTRNRQPGLCRICGYDLRATPEDQSRYPLNYASRFGADRGH